MLVNNNAYKVCSLELHNFFNAFSRSYSSVTCYINGREILSGIS